MIVLLYNVITIGTANLKGINPGRMRQLAVLLVFSLTFIYKLESERHTFDVL